MKNWGRLVSSCMMLMVGKVLIGIEKEEEEDDDKERKEASKLVLIGDRLRSSPLLFLFCL